MVAVLFCWGFPAAHADDFFNPDAAPEANIPLEDLPDHLPPDQVVAVAKRLIAAGQSDPARRLLELTKEKAPDETEVRFLLGAIAVMESRNEDAVDIFRAILVDQPGLTRVRLELARALFAGRNDEAAEYHFRLALAEQPPGPVTQNIWRFLDTIRARRIWRYSLSVSVAPDTNINAAPEDERVDLFGIPFVLDDEALEKSGVGFVASGSASYTPQLWGRTKLDSGIFARHSEYSGSEFDDTFVSGHIGPSFRWLKTRLSLNARGSYRWFGGERYNRTIGFQASLSRDLNPRVNLGVSLGYSHVNYFTNNDLDGPIFSSLVAVTYGLSSRSFLRGILGASIEDARSRFFSNTGLRAGIGYHREFSWGIIAYLQPEIVYNPYKGIQPAFGKRRTDWEYRVGLSIVKRDISWLGLSPELRYTFVRNDSGIDFFSYTRHRVEVGLTKLF